MFNAEAIDKINEGATTYMARQSINEALGIDGKAVAALPHNFTVHDLEKMLPKRRRARGTMETYVVEDFAAYTKAHRELGASVFVDQDHMNAVAILNLGTPSDPGHADNRAKLVAKRTAAYQALLNIAYGTAHKQAVIAEFFEDWPGLLQFFNDEGSIAPPKAIAAVRKVTIEELRKLESEEKQLSASRSAFESVQVTSADQLPTTIYFTCEPYAGLASRQFVLRLSVQTGGDKAAIALRVVKQEEHDEQMAEELAGLVSAAIQDTPVLIGKYAASA